MSILRDSKWEYRTAATGAVGVVFVAASGGTVMLTDPQGKDEEFWYGGLGVAWSGGFRIPRLPKLQVRSRSVSGAGAAKAFPSWGLVYMMQQFRGAEVTRSDIEGGTLYVDAGVGLIAGVAGAAMLLGMNPALLAAGIAGGPIGQLMLQQAFRSATGVLLMTGVTAGAQAGGGVGLMAEYLR